MDHPEYPFSTPQILTEQMFVDNGGHTGTASHAQVQNAFVIAEQEMTEELHCFLVPTTITGSYWVEDVAQPLQLKWGRLVSLGPVYHHYERYIDNFRSGTYAEYPAAAFVRDWNASIIDPGPAYTYVGMQEAVVHVVYTSGLQSGTSMTDKGLHMGLAIAADLILNEMVNPGTEEVQVGIQRFTSMKYTEERVPLKQTAFGSSARANFAAKLVQHLKVARVGRLH